MARLRPGTGKTMAQGTSVGRPHNSPLMKLVRPDQEQPDGRDGSDQIEIRQDRDAPAPGEQDDGQSRADQPAVEGHAAMPDRGISSGLAK